MRIHRSRYQKGSIRRVPRANGFAWEVRFSESLNGKRRQKCLTFDPSEYPTEASVRKSIEQQVITQNKKTERVKVDARFDALCSLYRREHLPTLRHSTQSTNEYLLRDYIEPRWSSERIRDVSPLAVTLWIRDLRSLSDPAKVLSPTLMASIRSIMRQCFELAALHGYLPPTERNPMSLVRIKGTGMRRKEIQPLTPREFQKLLGHLKEPVNLMVLLAGSLGLRVSEMVALKWEDIDKADRSIAIRRSFTRNRLDETKTPASHARLPIDDVLLSMLAAWRPRTDHSEWLFPSRITGGPQSASMLLQKKIKPVAERLKLGNIGWHTLRHSYRTWLDAKGTPVGVQKDLLRHSDIGTTMNLYGRSLAPDMRAGHHAVVSELLPKSMRKSRKMQGRRKLPPPR
ncbi:MAG: site-specific integrase [Acidobacteriaceae bacterium]